MTARDSNRMWGAGRCAQLSRLDHDDGLTCDIHADSPCFYDIAPRKPWLTADHWLLIVCMAVLACVLAVAYTVGQQARCDRLAAAGDPAAATYCPRGNTMMRVRAFHSPSGSVVVGEITDINATGDVRMVPDGMLESVILRNGVWVMAVSETKP